MPLAGNADIAVDRQIKNELILFAESLEIDGDNHGQASAV